LLAQVYPENAPLVSSREGSSQGGGDTRETQQAGLSRDGAAFTTNGSEDPSKLKLMFLTMGLKLVVMPMLCFPVSWLLIRAGAVSREDRLMHMVIYIEVSN
jgi:hypothetical protein